MISEKRIKHLVGGPPRKGRYVLYWMQQAQRTTCNHALEYAIHQANSLQLPFVVCFVITELFPEANLRHYAFMFEGLEDVRAALKKRGFHFVLQAGDMVDAVLALASDAALVVTDYGYLRVQRQWRQQVAENIGCPFTVVETDVVVPVGAASWKEEFAARTLRSKLLAKIEEFLVPVAHEKHRDPTSRKLEFEGTIQTDLKTVLEQLHIDRTVSQVNTFRGGEQAAKKMLHHFISQEFHKYPELSRDPVAQCQSNLSPYLHFGHISPVEIALEVKRAYAPEKAKDAFIEQLVVRRELSMNFVSYNDQYDRYEGAVPAWAQESLEKHRKDRRPYLYQPEELERGDTHDPYWNAAQREMMLTGKMHNYMRMYWGKKIIEWSESPQEAFQVMLSLNNKYELDGRDPNGFAGVAWCFGKHDRPWQERPVFGKVRYMNAAGLERKFRMNEYVKRIDALDQIS